jgi:hypothetical protein
MNEQDFETADPGGPIDSRAAFVAAVHRAVAQALACGARRMVWVDADLVDWPVDDEALLQSLSQWLRLPQRRLLLLAQDYDAVARRHPRFVAWYRLWSHAVAAFSPASDATITLPCALLADDAVLVHLLEPQRWHGWSAGEPATLRQWRDRLDALLQQSVPAFPVTTLGL